MKRIFFTALLTSSILLGSCSNKGSFQPKVIKLDSASTKEVLSLKNDVLSKLSASDSNTLLNLCFTDFAFDSVNRSTVLLVYNTADPGKVRSILLDDTNFVEVCSARGLDTSDVPPYLYLNKEIFRGN